MDDHGHADGSVTTGNNTGLDGLTVNGTVGPQSGAAFAITAINYAPSTAMLTLTWNSRTNDVYSVRFSSDLIDWEGDIGDSLTMANDDENPADGDFLTKTFDLADFGLQSETDLFLRVQRE